MKCPGSEPQCHDTCYLCYMLMVVYKICYFLIPQVTQIFLDSQDFNTYIFDLHALDFYHACESKNFYNVLYSLTAAHMVKSDIFHLDFLYHKGVEDLQCIQLFCSQKLTSKEHSQSSKQYSLTTRSSPTPVSLQKATTFILLNAGKELLSQYPTTANVEK